MCRTAKCASGLYFSKIGNAWRHAYVYTPPGYDNSNTRYPVLYLQHGAVRAVGVDDRRAIEATLPVALIEVEDNHDAEAREHGVRTDRSWDPADSLSVAPWGAAGWPLREETLEGNFGKDHQLGATARRTLESREPAADIVCLVGPS